MQRILREEKPKRRSFKASIVPAEGCEPTHLLAPKQINRIWHLDLTTLRILWLQFTVAVLKDGFSRRVLRLKVYASVPKTSDMLRLVRTAVRSFEQPRSRTPPYSLVKEHHNPASRFTRTKTEQNERQPSGCL